jgi:hypothetical protein
MKFDIWSCLLGLAIGIAARFVENWLRKISYMKTISTPEELSKELREFTYEERTRRFQTPPKITKENKS